MSLHHINTLINMAGSGVSNWLIIGFKKTLSEGKFVISARLVLHLQNSLALPCQDVSSRDHPMRSKTIKAFQYNSLHRRIKMSALKGSVLFLNVAETATG